MLRRISFPTWSVPVVLLGVTLAAYGWFAAQQGYHWDDWGIIWLATLPSPQELIEYFSAARPLWGYIYAAITSLIGMDPFAWQVFALATRWLAALALWWCLRLTWPRHPWFSFWVTIFALVYPGFSQHSIAIAYGNYSLMFAVFYASLGLSLRALRTQGSKAGLVIGALILSALQLFSTEYFIGLELLRPVLFWLVLGESVPESRPRLMRTIKAYLPYGLVVITFLVWRVFFFESQLYEISALGQPATLITSLPRQVGRAVWNSLFAAWGGVFRLPPSDEMGARLTVLYWAILFIGFIFLTLYPNRLRSVQSASDGSRRPYLQWLAVGGLALLTAGIPFYAARLPVELKYPNDRFTQPFGLGTALLLAAALEMLPRVSWRALAAGLLAALAIGLQVQNTFFFREDWESQKAYFWQLTWRVPALQSGTAILSERSPFRFTDDDALSFPTNWAYVPEHDGSHLYQQVSIATRLNFQSSSMKFLQPIEGKLFTGDFIISPDAIIVTQFAPPSCLRVLHPVYDADLPVAPNSREVTESLLDSGFPFLRREEASALPLSDMQQIVSSPDQPARLPEAIFGTEPPRQWCYYFEKADLARSVGDWSEVVRLGDEAFSVPYHPNNLAEYLPFIEAYARLDRFKDARQLTVDAALQMPVLKPALCALWQRVSASGMLSESEQILAGQIQAELQYCPVEGK